MSAVLERRVDNLEEMMAELIQVNKAAEERLAVYIAQSSQEMREFKGEMREFKDEMREFKDEMRGFKDEMCEFKDEMREFKDEMRTLFAEADARLQKHIAHSEQQIDRLSQEVASVWQAVEKVSQEVASVWQAVEKVSQEVVSVCQAVEKVSQEVASMWQAVEKMSQEVASVWQAVEKVSQEVASVSQEVASVSEKMDNGLQELNKKIGELAQKMGRLVEDAVYPGIAKIFTEITGLNASHIKWSGIRIKVGSANQREFDAVIISDEFILINETKSSLTSEDVKKFSKVMREKIRDYFPEHADKKFIGVVSSLYVDQSIVNQGSNLGLYVLGFRKDLMDVLNPPEFKPTYF